MVVAEVVEVVVSAVADSVVVADSGSAVVEVAAEGWAAVGVGGGVGVGSDEHAAATTRAKEPITAIKIVRKHICPADVSNIAMQPYSPSVASGDEHCPAYEGPGGEVSQCLVGVTQRVGHDDGAYVAPQSQLRQFH